MAFTLLDDDDARMAACKDNYCGYLEKMTGQTAGLGAKYFAKEARFQAPFFDLQGRTPIVEYFIDRVRAAPNYKFKIIERFDSVDGHTIYLRWDWITTIKNRAKTISGMSEITFSLSGEVLSHIEYYDALQAYLYDKPIVGKILKRQHKFVK